MKAKKGKFKIDCLPRVYDGYKLTGPADTFNGHPQPMFSPGVVEQIREDFYSLFGRFEQIETEDGIRYLSYVGWQFLKWEEI